MINAGTPLHLLAHMQSLFPSRQQDVITSWTPFLFVSVYLMENAYYVHMQHPREGNGCGFFAHSDVLFDCMRVDLTKPKL